MYLFLVHVDEITEVFFNYFPVHAFFATRGARVNVRFVVQIVCLKIALNWNYVTKPNAIFEFWIEVSANHRAQVLPRN
ncbi:hypothetical protein BH11CYA1_BH11CYA1_07520 [soil metagenome]